MDWEWAPYRREREARHTLTARAYTITDPMIARATDRRAAGDWRGACAAANVDVDLDLDAIADTHGTATAAAVLDDLRHLVPDLLRWHLARDMYDDARVRWNRAGAALASYPDGSALAVALPNHGTRARRLRLRHEPDATALNRWQTLHWNREYWDVRAAPRLRARTGGGGHVPFWAADGTERTGPHDDAERRITLQDQHRFDEAWVLAGMPLDATALDDPETPSYLRSNARWDLEYRPVDPPSLLEVARAAARPVLLALWVHSCFVLVDPGGAARVVLGPIPHRDPAWLIAPYAVATRPIDYELLRSGLLTPDELHPLVRAAFFPAAPTIDDAPDRVTLRERPLPPGFAPFRVRCRGDWHWVRMADGAVRTGHSAEEHRREFALRALGGELTGCFAAAASWHDPRARRPRPLRALRHELALRLRYGDVDGVTELLDAGLDPRVRFGAGRTLLHLLSHLPEDGAVALLPRLLDAGLDVDARDADGRGPVFAAALEGRTRLRAALIGAGGDPSDLPRAHAAGQEIA